MIIEDKIIELQKKYESLSEYVAKLEKRILVLETPKILEIEALVNSKNQLKYKRDILTNVKIDIIYKTINNNLSCSMFINKSTTTVVFARHLFYFILKKYYKESTNDIMLRVKNIYKFRVKNDIRASIDFGINKIEDIIDLNIKTNRYIQIMQVLKQLNLE